MLLVYSLILAAIIILAAALRKYNIEYKKSLSKKEHPFLFLYGLCFFLTDIYIKLYQKIKPNKAEPFHTLKDKIHKLYPGKNAAGIFYGTLAKRISASIAVLMLFMIAGIIYSLSLLSSDSSGITELSRPDGSDDITYTLIADTEETTELVEINVSKKMYEYNEIITLFDKYREDILDAMLGENISSDYVTKALSFPSSIGDEEISLSWLPENLSFIDLNGELIYENISAEGTHTAVYVTMKLEDTEATLMVGVILYPDTSDSASLINAQIMNFIDENNSPYSDKVSLPSSIDGKSVTFSLPKDNNNGLIFFMGLAACVMLFFAYSSELNSKVKLRNEQMISDYPEIVSKLLLLSNAGLSIQNAFRKIANDYYNGLPSDKAPHFAYEELSITLNSLNSGKSENTAYTDYGKRCGLMPYMKLGSLLEQNLNKGAKEMKFHLNNEVKNAFQNYKSETITKSKQAETKLLLPMILMLVVVMLLIMVPSFMNM